MKSLIESLHRTLLDFVEQRDHLILTLSARAPADLAYAVRLLDAEGKQRSRDIVLLATHAAESPSAYVDGLARLADAQIALGNAGIEEGLGRRGARPWPLLPPACHDPRLPPRDRVRALVLHLRSEAPDPDSERIVLGLIPLRSQAPAARQAYAEVARALFPVGAYEPWMAGLRIFLADLVEDPRLLPFMAEPGRFGGLVYDLDFSTTALIEASARDALDPATPMDERMLSLAQLAAVDYGWQRYEEALAKYGAAFQHFLQRPGHPMAGVCLLGAGQVHLRRGELDQAEARFAQALTLATQGGPEGATEGGSKPLALNATLEIAGLCALRQRWAEAEAYYKLTALLGRELGLAHVISDALRERGRCQLALGDPAGAVESWEGSAELAARARYPQAQLAARRLLLGLAERRGHPEELARRRAEVEEAERGISAQAEEIREATAPLSAGPQPGPSAGGPGGAR